MQEMQETWVQSLGWEDFLEEDMATNSSILAWRIPWTEESGSTHLEGPEGLQSIGSKRAGHNWNDLAHTHNKKYILFSMMYFYNRKNISISL